MSIDADIAINMRWWELKGPKKQAKDKLAIDLRNTYIHLEENDRVRQKRLRLWHSHYTNREHKYGSLPWGMEGDLFIDGRGNLTFNVIGQMVDTVTARIGKLRPSPRPVPVGGNASLARKARHMRRFLEAQFRISDCYKQSSYVFRDAATFGTGIMKPHAVGDKVVLDRVLPSEVLVDPHDAMYGEPTHVYQRKWIPRTVLQAVFGGPDKPTEERKRVERVLLNSTHIIGDRHTDYDDSLDIAVSNPLARDLVMVVEGWHLPSGPGAGDGRRAVVTSAGYLAVEDWEHDYLPFLFMHWRRPLRGFWGIGLAEDLLGTQLEINTLLQKIQGAHNKLGQPYILIDKSNGTRFAEDTFTNEIGQFVPYSGTPPVVVTNQTMHPEIYNHLERLKAQARDIAGVSHDTTSPQMQSISGVSAQTQHEIGSERFVIQGQDYEGFHLDVAHRCLDLGKEIQKKHPRFGLPSVRDRYSVDHIQFKDVNMEEDEYVLAIFPQSSLPTLPGPKQDRVIMMLQAGLIGVEEAMELLDMPDLDAKLDLVQASRRAIERALETMLDSEELVYVPPSTYWDLQLALKLGQQALNKAENNDVPEERLDLLRSFLTETHKLMQQAQVEQMKLAAAQAAQGEGPMAPGPGAPPAPGPDGQPPMAAIPEANNPGMI